MLAGAVLFFALVAEPAFSNAGKDARLPARVGFPLRWLAWISLALVVVSGLAWLIVLAQHLSDGTVTAVLWDGIVWIVLNQNRLRRDLGGTVRAGRCDRRLLADHVRAAERAAAVGCSVRCGLPGRRIGVCRTRGRWRRHNRACPSRRRPCPSRRGSPLAWGPGS